MLKEEDEKDESIKSEDMKETPKQEAVADKTPKDKNCDINSLKVEEVEEIVKEYATNVAQGAAEMKTENARNNKVMKETKQLNHHAKNIIINYELEKKD